jgi:two-component system, response regulator
MVALSFEILLVEDNPNDVELTLHAFRKNNLSSRIDVVRDGVEALDYIYRTGQYTDRENGDPRLILLDLKLPRLNGLQVLERLKSDPEKKKIPVVVLTSSQQEQDILSSYNLGANSYVRKPVNFDRFTDVVRDMGFYWLQLNVPVD